MTRRRITEYDTDAYINLIKARFASWIDAGYDEPKAIENWDGRGNWAIVWEDGPYEWTFYATTGSFAYSEREPEFGFRLPIVPVPAKLSHIFSEPYSGSVLMLYLDT